jgi:Domain of unknown function (DUF4249)
MLTGLIDLILHLMKINLTIAFFVSILLLGATGCEKAISFKPADTTPKLVVEATIESGQAPVVILSNSLDYFGQINPQILLNSFVRNADVFISNGVRTHKLKEYTVDLGLGNRIFYYSIDSASLATAFTGTFNTRYSLRIVSNGKEYLANTTIPLLAKKIDSIWWKKAPDNPDTLRVALMAKTTDPPGLGNYIRYFTRRNSEPFYPGENSVFDDQIVDGTTYEVQVDRGLNRNGNNTEGENRVFFLRGDTITLKFTNIDKACFDFWRTMEFGYASVGNPFSTPTKVLGNISNGALGYFGGYAVQNISVVVPQ